MTRKEQAERTRAAIIGATQSLISEKGYDAVKVADIARACGIGAGTLYHYFKGKDEIFTYIERGRFDELAAEVLSGDDGIAQSLRSYTLGWFERVAADDVNVSRCWHVMAVELKLPNAQGRTHLDDDLGNLETMLNRAVDRGELRAETPVKALARDIAYSMYGASLARCIQYSGMDVLDWAETWCRDLLDARLAPFLAPSARACCA